MSYFVYDGTSIKTLLPGSELTIGALDGFDEIDGNLGREIIKGEVNSERYSPNYITSLFNDVVNFDLFIYKKDESDFTTEEQRKLTKLLTSAKTPKWFSSYDYKDNLIANYRGLFTQITYKIFGGLKGFQVHFENDSPYDYDIIKNKPLSELTYYVDDTQYPIESDTDEIIYPIIKITDKTGKNISLLQKIRRMDVSDDGSVTDMLLEENEMSFYVTASPFYIDCKRCLIYTESGACDYNVVKFDTTKTRWIRLLPNTICSFLSKENNGDYEENVDFVSVDYIVPQKRAIRWK